MWSVHAHLNPCVRLSLAREVLELLEKIVQLRFGDPFPGPLFPDINMVDLVTSPKLVDHGRILFNDLVAPFVDDVPSEHLVPPLWFLTDRSR